MKNVNLPDRSDIIIIGGGMAGLSAAASLSNMGINNVVLFEASNISNTSGSSFGESRMYREMYSDPVLCKLAKESNKLWAEQELQAQTQLRKEHGLLFYGESWDEETIEGSIPGAQKVMDQQNIPYEYLQSEDISKRFPIKAKKHFSGLFEPSAGAILSDKVIDYWQKIIISKRNKIFENCSVSNIDMLNNSIIINGSHKVSFDELIVSTGMWTNQLLKPLGFTLDVKIWPMVWGYYLVDNDFISKYPQWFCFQKERNEDGGLYYGFPVMSKNENNIPRIKVGLDWVSKNLISDDPLIMKKISIEPLKDFLNKFIHNNLEGVIKCDEIFVSPYTMTNDVNFILDKLKPNITIFSGGSGQAFKFAPLIGKCLAEKAIGKKCSSDISCWKLNRVLIKN